MPSSRVTFALSFALLVLCSSESVIRAQSKDLTVEDYCRLTISLMQLSVDEWQERVPVAEKIKTDRRKLETGLQPVTKKYLAQRSDALKQFGMDQQTYLRFTTDHKTEIDSYLEDNPEVQQAIDDLQKQIDKLIEQFESLASPKGAGK
jgi:hypothetical protein